MQIYLIYLSSDMGVDMATNTDDTAEIDKGVAANVRPMYSVGTSPPNSNANVNNNQVVVYNNNVNNGSVFCTHFRFFAYPVDNIARYFHSF